MLQQLAAGGSAQQGPGVMLLCRQLVKLESWKRAERRQIRAELRQLAKEERQRQQKAVQVGQQGVHCSRCCNRGCVGACMRLGPQAPQGGGINASLHACCVGRQCAEQLPEWRLAALMSRYCLSAKL